MRLTKLNHDGPLRSNGNGNNGSASAGWARDLTAAKLTPKLSDRIADVRGRQ